MFVVLPAAAPWIGSPATPVLLRDGAALPGFAFLRGSLSTVQSACDVRASRKRISSNDDASKRPDETLADQPLPPPNSGDAPRAKAKHQRELSDDKDREWCTHRFVCEQCGDRFTKNFSLKRHQKCHTRERPHACTFPGCGKAFAEKHTLKVCLCPHGRVFILRSVIA